MGPLIFGNSHIVNNRVLGVWYLKLSPLTASQEFTRLARPFRAQLLRPVPLLWVSWQSSGWPLGLGPKNFRTLTKKL